ncbi:hypothetical protein O4J56_28960 [Nocardiopsis sp. RSe5-2]|uniref:LPXTG cell wall anchor domain-containing protein n=1 Tax=Nocardiopsis endophytica TaxID=3018445 RepID=A0ABT4UCJ0_9ACTN|nr:hypothetical protein [Nocardiopsis endophytica]MDA2814709.1 hypothetical protein [Nocardiopsis endophytica]
MSRTTPSRTAPRAAAGFAVFGFAALGALGTAAPASAEPEPITKDIAYHCTSQGGWETSGDIEWKFNVTNGSSFDPGDQVAALGNSQWRYAYPETEHGNVTRVIVRHEVDLSGGAATDEKLTFQSKWNGSAPPEAFSEGTEGGDWQYPSQPAGTRAGDGSSLVFSGGDVVASVLFEDGEHWVTTCSPTGDAEIMSVAVSGKPDPEEPEDPEDPGDEDPGGDDGDGGGDEDPGGDDGDGGGDQDPGGDDGDKGDDQNPGGDDGDKGDEQKPGGDDKGDKGEDKPAPGKDSADGDKGSSLPVTGAALGGLVAAAVAAVGGGGAAMFFARKKKRAAADTEA